MILKKIRYKDKVNFDYFEIWLDEGNYFINIFDHQLVRVDRKIEDKATCVSTQICPWCTKKYGLYSEVKRTPESIDEEIRYYESNNTQPDDLDIICGIDGCENGAADYADISWDEGFKIIDKE